MAGTGAGAPLPPPRSLMLIVVSLAVAIALATLVEWRLAGAQESAPSLKVDLVVPADVNASDPGFPTDCASTSPMRRLRWPCRGARSFQRPGEIGLCG